MQLNGNNPQENDIYKLLSELYYEVMQMKSDYMNRRRKGEKDLKDLKEEIEGLDEDYISLAKTHTVFLRLQKAAGVRNPAHSTEMLQKIAEIRTNVGQIVSMIPKPNKDVTV